MLVTSASASFHSKLTIPLARSSSNAEPSSLITLRAPLVSFALSLARLAFLGFLLS